MKPTVQSSQILFSGFFDVRQDLLQRADGLTHSYNALIVTVPAAVILAQDPSGRWILNREYRHPTGETLLGLPGGRLEKGEDPIAGGQRELYEETGYWAEEIQLLGSCYPFPGICDQKMFYLFAKNAVFRGGQKLDPFEFIEIELKSDAELKEAILGGSNIDGNLCTALWYKDHFC